MSNTIVFLALGTLGGWEILLIVLVLLIFFGAKKIPELARGMGKGIREFKDATREIKQEIEDSVNEPPPSPPPAKKENSGEDKSGEGNEKTS